MDNLFTPLSNKTHRSIDETDLFKLIDDLLAFLKGQKSRITWQGPEYDYWKAKYTYTLKESTYPDNYFNLEKIQKSDIHKRSVYLYDSPVNKKPLYRRSGFLAFSYR